MTTPPPADPPADRPHGPRVADAETLLRAVTPGAAASWLPDGEPSSLLYNPPKFSVDVESLTTLTEMLTRWPAGSGLVSFGAGDARELEFVAHLEPEHGNDAHANVYCALNTSQRKRMARLLAARTTVRVLPAAPAAG